VSDGNEPREAPEVAASAKYVLLGWALGPATLLAVPVAHALWPVDAVLVEQLAWYARGLGLLVTAVCFAHAPSRRCPEFWVLVAYQPACALFWWGLLAWPAVPYELAVWFALLVSFAIAIPCLAIARWCAGPVSGAARPR
jgi:hypothetical protein